MTPEYSLKMLGAQALLNFKILSDSGIKHGLAVKTDGRPVDKQGVYRILSAQGKLAVTHQTHSDRIEIIKNGCRRLYPRKIQADGLMSDVKGLAITIHTADCIPVFLASQDGRAVCLIHAGWRGTAEGIVFKGLKLFLDTYRLNAGKVLAVIGPGIERSCYRVGPEVAARFDAEDKIPDGPGRYLLDIKQANRSQLMRAGLPSKNIQCPGLCTACRNDMLHSYRAEKNLKGQMIAFMEAEK